MIKEWGQDSMAKKFQVFFAIIMAAFIGSAAYARAQISWLDAWVGTYEYGDTLGKTAGSTPIIIDIILELKSDGGCNIESEGYMQDEHILCRAIPQDSGVKITFLGYSSDQQIRPIGNYSQGDLLFTLMKRDGAILTKWGKLKPSPELKNVGKYFQ
jgi:hypothetical protein